MTGTPPHQNSLAAEIAVERSRRSAVTRGGGVPPLSTASARPRETPPPLRALLADPWLGAILLLALAFRILVWRIAPYTGRIGDEGEYYSAAAILADGRGFSFLDQSIWLRPPLYIVALAAFFRLFGTATGPVWLAQVAIGLATIALVYLLGRAYAERRAVARLAAALCAVYLPFAVYARLLLSETLFTFLIVLAFVALARHARGGGRGALIVAGGALGGAILTRGLALPFLAAIPPWALALERRGGRFDWRGALARSALVIGVALAILAPWTARNAVVYGRLIPSDTTGGYNFWLGALQGQNVGQIDTTLRAIPNQGDRQTLAWARGWAVVRADPGTYLGKSVREAGDLWRINIGAYERLTRGYALGRVPIPWLGLTLALDDLLYLLALPLAALGWVGAGRPVDRRLLLLWLVYNTVAGALFFAITRFRLPLMPFVFLLAARGAFALPPLLRGALGSGFRIPRPWFASATVAALAIALVFPSFTFEQFRVGAANAPDGDRLARGYALLARGQADAALASFVAIRPDDPFRPTALAAVAHAQGRDDRALAGLDDDRDPTGATLLRGDILRAQGRLAEARESLNYRDIRVLNPTAEAWAHLNPPPLARLDVGDGLDLGYLRGLNLDERDADGTTYRWTSGTADLRVAAPANPGAATLRLRLRGYRPNGALPPVRLSVSGRAIGTVTPTTDWRTYDVPLVGTGATDGWLVVNLATPTFVLSYADQRQLGVMVDWAEVR
jgi:4-amino-4-deoxy-L-arabinose transferase-like glycosyltransferase